MPAKRAYIWLQAFRLHTLPLAFACIALANFLTYANKAFDPLIAALTFVTAIALQILSNLANDYGDFKNGADNAGRIGPQRVTQSGLVSAAQIKIGVFVFSLLSFLSGILLIILSIENIGYEGAMILLLIGLISIAAAIAYTATKNPYGYRGFGDISVFIFFGPVAVVGAYYLQAGKFNDLILLPSFGMGLLSTAVLNVNNIRDIEADSGANKKTIAVRLGLKKAKIYQWSLVLSAMMFFALYLFIKFENLTSLLLLLPGILMLFICYKITEADEPYEINPYLKKLVLSILLFVLVFGLGICYLIMNYE